MAQIMTRQAHDEMLIALSRSDFLAFCEKGFTTLNSGGVLRRNWHHDAIGFELGEMKAGRNLRLIVTVPPRSLKSHMISVAWSAWLLGQNPSARIICVSYSDTIAEQLSSDTRRLIESDFYRAVFPETRLTRATLNRIETDQGGFRLSTSVGGAITGLGADWIIVDDPLNASDTFSEPARKTVNDYFDKALSSRLNDPATGRIIVVMQRLHEDDLAGHLLERGGWKQLKIQAVATADQEIEVGPSMTHRVLTGDLLHADRLPLSFLEDQKRTMGSVAFQAQYQQSPVPAEGATIKRAWLRYYDQLPPLCEGSVTLSIDTALKDEPSNDYSAGTVWFRHEAGDHYLLETWRDRVAFPDLLRAVKGLVGAHRPSTVLIEDTGSGTSLIQSLKVEGIYAVGRKPKDPKIVRLAGVSSIIESGSVHLPKERSWLAEFEKELLGFPSAKHDDQVDTVSQYLMWARERFAASFFHCDWGYDDPNGGGVPDADHLLSRRWW